MPEYAFDISLAAVARIKADTVQQAREKLEEAGDEFNVMIEPVPGVTITAASFDNEQPIHLFEVDGENVEKIR